MGPRLHGEPAGAGHAPETAEPDALLRAVARGDEAAFGRLYDLVAGRVYGLAKRIWCSRTAPGWRRP